MNGVQHLHVGYVCPATHVITMLTRKDMTHSVISIDSIILNSMSTVSSAGKASDHRGQSSFIIYVIPHALFNERRREPLAPDPC